MFLRSQMDMVDMKIHVYGDNGQRTRFDHFPFALLQLAPIQSTHTNALTTAIGDERSGPTCDTHPPPYPPPGTKVQLMP